MDEVLFKKYFFAVLKSVFSFLFLFLVFQILYIIYAIITNRSFLFFNLFQLSSTFTPYFVFSYLMILGFFLYRSKDKLF